jgi:hypothetical protein
MGAVGSSTDYHSKMYIPGHPGGIVPFPISLAFDTKSTERVDGASGPADLRECRGARRIHQIKGAWRDTTCNHVDIASTSEVYRCGQRRMVHPSPDIDGNDRGGSLRGADSDRGQYSNNQQTQDLILSRVHGVFLSVC